MKSLGVEWDQKRLVFPPVRRFGIESQKVFPRSKLPLVLPFSLVRLGVTVQPPMLLLRIYAIEMLESVIRWVACAARIGALMGSHGRGT